MGQTMNEIVLDISEQKKGLLRFATAGSVDDGKSTLIGRLLYDTGIVFDDQLRHVQDVSQRRGDERTNLALLTDGLRAEREQGITIDVAYRYFTTAKRKFILADSPGHLQYTRNMVTGASVSDLVIVLIDARNGLSEQSKRHAFLATLLGIKHIVFAVNKMDLVYYSKTVYDEICRETKNWLSSVEEIKSYFIPINALDGDNIVKKSSQLSWYEGHTLLGLLENVDIKLPTATDSPMRFPVQWVIRPQSKEYPDYRGYCGTLASGSLRAGDDVVVLPRGTTTKLKKLETMDGLLEKAYASKALTLHLEAALDISRGDMICSVADQPRVSHELKANIVWMSCQPLEKRKRYALKHTTRWVKAMVTEIDHEVNIHHLKEEQKTEKLELNAIGKVSLKTVEPLFYDAYKKNRITGSFILVDEATHETVGAGMLI